MILKLYLPGKLRLSFGKNFLKNAVGNEIHYIGGSEVLPPPLEGEEENRAINGLETEHANEARTLLIEHNLRLVVYIAKKFDNTGVGVEDLISIGTIGLIKAINTFNRSKNIKLATYASRCIENEILMHLRKVNNSKHELSFDEPLSIDWDGNELTLRDVLGSEPDEISVDIEYSDEKKLLLKIINSLSDKERELMKMRFGIMGETEHTQKELADLMGISQSYISRLEKRIIEKIRNEMMREYV